MLRSTRELTRYDVEASDGTIGRLGDLYFDDRTWRIRYIVVDAGGFLEHHEVLVSPEDVVKVRFPEEALVLRSSKAQVAARPNATTAPPVSLQQDKRSDHSPVGQSNQHLRSAATIASYRATAADDELGRIHGLMIETTNWVVRYLIVDTGGLVTSKLVLLAVQAVSEIVWERKTVKVNVTSETIEDCPQYDGDSELSRDYEAFLHDYYGWPPYWK